MKIKQFIYLFFFTAICISHGKTKKKAILGTQINKSIIQRNESETVEQFVERLKPENSKISHKVISIQWNSFPVLIAFYDQTYKLPKKQDPEQTIYHRIIATLFIENQKNNYSKLIINTFDTDGGSPKIETVLFANADKDIFKELIIIVSWEQSTQEVSGTTYNTFVYDDLSKSNQDELVFLKDISSKLDGGCECSFSDGRHKKAKFKTAKDIKTGLLKLGYR
jgi:hypothetical protein